MDSEPVQVSGFGLMALLLVEPALGSTQLEGEPPLYYIVVAHVGPGVDLPAGAAGVHGSLWIGQSTALAP
jgi:hypothetical protein